MNIQNQSDAACTLAGLPEGVSILKVTKRAHTSDLLISWPEPGIEQRFCPSCGSTHCVKKDAGASQTVRHLSSAGAALLITFHKPRFLCRACGKSFYMKPPWVAPDISITLHLFFRIYWLLTSTPHSISEIARETGTTPAIVLNVISHINLGQPSSLPETLGIDEFHGQTGTWDPNKHRFDTERFHCCITDPDLGSVIDIRKSATAGDLKDYFFSFPLYQRQHVKFFCSDMRSGFISVARACFPNTRICIDPFHVVKLITSVISDIRTGEAHVIRKKLQGDLSDEVRTRLETDCSILRNAQRLLTTSPYNPDRYWNLDTQKVKRKERLREVFRICPDLELAHQALMEFYDITHEKNFYHRRADLTDWINRYISCDSPELSRAAKTISTRRTGIENAWRYHKSNSPTEVQNVTVTGQQGRNSRPAKDIIPGQLLS